MSQSSGVLVVNSSLIPQKSKRKDITVTYVPATATAAAMGQIKAANSVCLGALVQATGLFELAAIEQTMDKHLLCKTHPLFLKISERF